MVQSVDAEQRTATVLFMDTGSIELTSLLELDAHGMLDQDAHEAPLQADGLGVRRGEFVFIHPPHATNGFQIPRVPRIGELEAWIREPTYLNGQLAGWRKEMSEIGQGIAKSRGSGFVDGQMIQPHMSSLPWIGEVIDVCPFLPTMLRAHFLPSYESMDL